MSADSAPSPAAPRPHAGFRDDIQGLRALAILLVLLHHARIPGIPGGFLGVDLFFVISGFLMGTQIDSKLSAGTFSFLDFYARRIRRILPASYATLIVTAIAAPFLLDSVEYRSFIDQLAGAFTFVVNIVLWRQSDYFSTGADLKPLLHMWSLAIEEQFYLGLPLLLFLLPHRLRLPATVVVAVISLALCLWLLPRAPSATFYMLPTRAWELGFGTIAALLVNRGLAPPRAMPLARLAALFAIIATAILTDNNGHPGFAALIVCAAAALLMVPGSRWTARGAARSLTLIGDRSYSLYLVHWPLFAFANNIYVGEVPMTVNLLLLALCFPLAELQYRFVEQPFRRARVDTRRIAALVAIPVLVTTAAFSAPRLQTASAVTQDRQPNHGFSVQCGFADKLIAEPPCVSNPRADTLVWGDSFAMHLVPGVHTSAPAGVVQATKTVCGPFIGVAPVDTLTHQTPWSEQCLAFNDSVLAHVKANPQLRTIVLSSILLPYLQQERNSSWELLVRTPAGYDRTPQDPARVRAALRQTVEALRAMDRRVVLVAPPPGIDVDFSRCQLRMAEGKAILGHYPDCSFPLQEYRRYRQPVLAFLQAVQRDAFVPILSLDEALCSGGTCQTRKDDTILYADHGHLSQRGSILLARQMRWDQLIGGSVGAPHKTDSR